MENKKQNILDVLIKLSSLDFQNEVWVKQVYWDRVLNFGEAVETLGDYNFFDDLEKNELPNRDKIKVKDFAQMLLNFNESDNAAEMLQDRTWLLIVKEAKEVHDILEKHQWN